MGVTFETDFDEYVDYAIKVVNEFDLVNYKLILGSISFEMWLLAVKDIHHIRKHVSNL